MRIKDIILTRTTGVGEKNKIITSQGRITAVRELGSKLVFADLYSDGQKLQLMTESPLSRGDIVEATGSLLPDKPTPTLKCTALKILQACQARNIFPSERTGLLDPHLRIQHRHLDLLLNGPTHEVFRTRHGLIRRLRERLWANDFIEVETPILSSSAGGAEAEPFITQREGGGERLYMRIAPELYLKRCILGGMERVFELGKVFRNEGVDRTHQPEFTMCELYWAYASLSAVKKLVSELVEAELDIKQPIRTVDVVAGLERELKVDLKGVVRLTDRKKVADALYPL